MSYELEFKTVQIQVEESKLWVNAPQCILRIAGLDPKWVHKLAIYKPELDLIRELYPQYDPSKAHLGEMIDIRIPKQKTIRCPHEDCKHNQITDDKCRYQDVRLAFAKEGLLQCLDFEEVPDSDKNEMEVRNLP